MTRTLNSKIYTTHLFLQFFLSPLVLQFLAVNIVSVYLVNSPQNLVYYHICSVPFSIEARSVPLALEMSLVAYLLIFSIFFQVGVPYQGRVLNIESQCLDSSYVQFPKGYLNVGQFGMSNTRYSADVCVYKVWSYVYSSILMKQEAISFILYCI